MMIPKPPPPNCAHECFNYDENMCGSSSRHAHCEKIGQRTQEHIDKDKDYGERTMAAHKEWAEALRQRQRGAEHTIGLISAARKRKHDSPTFWQRMLAYVLRFIDRLNGQVGIYEDDKHMPDGEEMTTLADLFNEVEQVKEKPRPPRPAQNPGNTSTSR